MLFLNVSEGELKIDEKFSIKINTTEDDLKSICNDYFVEVIPAGKESNYYTIHDIDDGEFDLVSLFNRDKLQWISISLGSKYSFPPFVITPEEKRIVIRTLNEMGGENNYPWGSAEFNEDIKGGIVSVLIKYNQ